MKFNLLFVCVCFFSLFSTALSLLQGKIAPENVHVLMYQSYLNYFFGEIGLKSCLIPCKFRESWRVNSSSIYTIYTHRAYSILYVFIINLLETFELSMRLSLLEREKKVLEQVGIKSIIDLNYPAICLLKSIFIRLRNQFKAFWPNLIFMRWLSFYFDHLSFFVCSCVCRTFGCCFFSKWQTYGKNMIKISLEAQKTHSSIKQ